MRLLACTSCHAQLDVTDVEAPLVGCPCGATVPNRRRPAVDEPVHRCSACGATLDGGADACSYCRAAVVRDPRRLGLVCPVCFARTLPSGRFCVACGVAIRPRAVLPAGSGFDCPVCDRRLATVDLGGIGVHECDGCGGTWVRPDAFDAVVDRVRAREHGGASAGLAWRRPGRAVEAGGPVVYRRCPECREVMHRRNFGRSSGIVVDWCRAHGTWLDAAELEAVATFVGAGGLVERRPDPRLDGAMRTSLAQAGRAGSDEGLRGNRSALEVLIDLIR